VDLHDRGGIGADHRSSLWKASRYFYGSPVCTFLSVCRDGGTTGELAGSRHVLVVYTLGIVAQTASSSLPSIFRILFAVVLLSNLRATFLASKWKPAAEGEDQPTRFNETLTDKFVDQMPAKLWPILQIPFLILGISKLLFVLTVFGFAIAHRFGLVPHQ
jgi:hypothetical protein